MNKTAIRKMTLDNQGMRIECELSETSNYPGLLVEITKLLDSIDDPEVLELLATISESSKFHIVSISSVTDNPQEAGVQAYGILINQSDFIANHFDLLYASNNCQFVYVELESGKMRAYNYDSEFNEDENDLNEILESIVLIIPERFKADSYLTVENGLGYVRVKPIKIDSIYSLIENLDLFAYTPDMSKALKVYNVIDKLNDIVWEVAFNENGIVCQIKADNGLIIHPVINYESPSEFSVGMKSNHGGFDVLLKREKHELTLISYNEGRIVATKVQVYNAAGELVKVILNGEIITRVEYHPNGKIKTLYKNDGGIQPTTLVFNENSRLVKRYITNDIDGVETEVVYSVEEFVPIID